MTVEDLARTMPRINVALENRQADYQTSMLKVEGKINQKPIAILIDLGASLSYNTMVIHIGEFECLRYDSNLPTKADSKVNLEWGKSPLELTNVTSDN